ncbi:MAG: FtsX-like permease family protein [Thermoanaerobaculia bacterium]|nr:FtsX-like permease family protein [Thermoanaerobaculia bacterium]
MYEIRIALRYLWMSRRKAHTAFLSVISVLGLAVGVATLLVSLALLSGLQSEIKERLMSEGPHLVIEPRGAIGVDRPNEVIAALETAGADLVHPVIAGTVWVSDPEGTRGRPARIRSFISTEELSRDMSFGREWVAEEIDPDRAVAVTRDLMSTLGIFLRGELIVVTPRTRLTPFGPSPVWKKYRVARILPPAFDSTEPKLMVPFEELSSLLGTEGLPTAIEVHARPAEALRFRDQLSRQFPNLLFNTWQEINRPLFLALRLEKIVMFATISLVILVAALNLISTMAMVIIEKRPQIGVIRTLGASEKSVRNTFLLYGLLIGVSGTLLGNLLGLGFSWTAEETNLISLPAGIYFADHLPFRIDLTDVLGVNLVAILLSVITTWWPARAAARLDPVVAIREEG